MFLPYKLKSKINADCFAAVCVSLVPLLYFYPAVVGRNVISPDDGVVFNVPLRTAAARIVLDGHLPLWNPYVFGGMPLIGAAQGGVFFPLNWFFLVFEPSIAANLMMLSAYALAALGAYLYARRTGTSIAGAALTALVWQWCGFMIAQIGHTNIVHTASLLPWLLWAADGYGSTGVRRRGAALSAIVALQVFAGHQQTLVYSLLLACAYSIVMARAATDGAVRRRYLFALALIAVGLLLGAAQILPTYELMRNSIRASASYDFFTSFSMPRAFLWTFFAPYIVGGGSGWLFRAPYTSAAFYGEYIGYAGLLTLMLSALALVLKRDAKNIFWAYVVLFGLLLALGRFLPFNLYKVVYYIPVINLFRVPARHLMEIDFALAFLAGRGLTALAGERGRTRALLMTATVCVFTFLLTWLAVTAGRPANFRLGRIAPVTILRAPELFMPLVVFALSAFALWGFARKRRGAHAVLFIVLAFDLMVWGHSSGWRTGPVKDDALWREPATVGIIRQLRGDREEPDRILTVAKAFMPDIQQPVGESSEGEFFIELQPNTYMMHSVENAAGYDGFGLERQSRLACDMKVWGELADARACLQGEGRGIDLMNVRYLIARDPRTDKPREPASKETAQALAAPQEFGGHGFAAADLGTPPLDNGERMVFVAPRVRAGKIAVVTSLAWSEKIPDATVVANLRLRAEDGRTFEFALRAGEHTSEWAFDRADLRARIRHRRAPVATSFKVEDASGAYEGHTYVAAFALPEEAVITGGEIEVARLEDAPDLALDVKRVSLANEAQVFALRPESVKHSPARGREEDENARWRKVAESAGLSVYENARRLPRVWLAPKISWLSDADALKTIRTGLLPDGKTWEPRQTALISPPQISKGGFNREENPGEAQIVRHEPNRIDVRASTQTAAVLVLSENFYPGWIAYVDGQRVETLRVNYNLRGVLLEPGEHSVSFLYRPKSFYMGLAISLLAVCGLTAWSVVLPRFGRRRQ